VVPAKSVTELRSEHGRTVFVLHSGQRAVEKNLDGQLDPGVVRLGPGNRKDQSSRLPVLGRSVHREGEYGHGNWAAGETFHGRSSQSSLNGSGKGRTEGGETGAEHFIGTASCLPSDANSAVLLDFVAVVDVSDRCRAVLMRSSNSSFPPVQLENPLFLGCGRTERSLQQVNGSHGVYAEGGGFCLSWG
jgi:hypothetical protein